MSMFQTVKAATLMEDVARVNTLQNEKRVALKQLSFYLFVPSMASTNSILPLGTPKYLQADSLELYKSLPK